MARKSKSVKVSVDMKHDILVRANEAFRDGNFDKCVQLFELGKSIWPKSPVWNYNLGVVSHKMRQFTKSLSWYAEAVKIDPKHYDSYLNMSNLHFEMKNFEQGVEEGRKAIKLDPKNGKAYYNLGRNYDALNKPDLAENAYKAAMRYAPDLVEPYIWLSKLYGNTGDYTKSMEIISKVPESLRDHPDVLNHLGTFAAFSKGDWNAALGYYRKAVEVKPDHAGASVNLGLTKLTLGDFSGWDQYYERFNISGGMYYFYERPWPRWNGVESFEGKEVLVWGDQGIGDTIIWGSMLGDLLKDAKRVVFECDKRLVRLFRRAFPGLEVYEIRREGHPSILKQKFDFHTSVLDLGRKYRRDPKTFPSGDKTAYLKANPTVIERYRKRYLEHGKTVIGLSWASHSPHVGAAKTIPVAELTYLFEKFPEACFVHLQFGPKIEDVLYLKEKLGDRYVIDGEINNYKELDKLAAQVAACDFVIGGSNSNIHLAGALGVPAYMMIAHGAGNLWYWFTQGEDSIWYASVQKFYKSIDEPWTAIVKRVADKVADIHGT